MRRLAEQLGVAVTSIYWHIGGRDKLFDSLVERLLGQMAHLPSDGENPVDRIASLARSQRRMLIEKQHLLSIAHERDRTPQLFLPIQQRLAAQLAELGITGSRRRPRLARRTSARHFLCNHAVFGGPWSQARRRGSFAMGGRVAGSALVEALQSPTDYDAVFEYGLNALLAPLRIDDRG